MCFITNDFFGNAELDQTAATNQLKQVIVQTNRINRTPYSRFASTLETQLIKEKILIIDQQLRGRSLIERKRRDILDPATTIQNDDALVNFLNDPDNHSPIRRAFLAFLRPHQRALLLTQLILLENAKLEPLKEKKDLSFNVIMLALILARDNHDNDAEKIINDYIFLLNHLGRPNDPQNDCLFATRELPTYQTADGKKTLVDIYNRCLSLIT